MSTLIEQTADAFYNLVALNDVTTIPIINNKRDTKDYDFFIHICAEYVRYFNDLIYRLKQEKDEVHKS